ncbi:MAG: SPOR domain-containing protein [Acidobacteria bacterium]|nr:SPOR domain-containing protein [Acidobacteriota bacterium]
MAHTQDDGFHEIQLNGKQLVFLFMAATVVSVVIFLCGVLVGRGVVAERAAASETSVAAADPTAAPPSAASSPETPAGSDPRAAAPPATVDDLSYFDRLEKPDSPKEELKAPPEPTSASAKTASPPPPPAPAAWEAPSPKPQPTASEPAGDYAVQVAALKVRDEADAIARRLTTKGYPAYVVPPGNGAVMYRVRVGRFKTRRDAEPIFAKLQKEEQFKPWITR